ncbi:MAG: RNA-binding domain-containing protein [Candidatus Bathyarchaeia archaeon]
MKSGVAYINLSFFVHATEDQEKVLAAVRNLFPPGYADKVSFSRSKLAGEYGNPIIFFRAQIREPDIAESLLLNISSNLPLIDKEDLSRHLDLHLDGGNLYLRLDKQEAYRGRFKLCRADPIRIHIRFKVSGFEEIRKACQAIGLLYEENVC